MCGRYTLTATAEELMAEFEFGEPVALSPRYNVAPTQFMPVIRVQELENEPGPREAVVMRWGLIPSWAKDASIGNRTINARSETVATQASFRAAFKRRRCIVPVSGFYEWETVEGPGGKPVKKPHLISRVGGLLGFAGLWECWRPPDAEPVLSYTILTTEANPLMKRLHTRMPVVLSKGDYGLWIDPKLQDAERLKALLCPYTGGDLVEHVVSTRVNNPRNDDAACVVATDGEGGLFG